jgi:lantibiotic leader peptide-processing serine protease
MICGQNNIPSTLASEVEAAGGKMVRTIPQIGLAVAESEAGDFAASAQATAKGLRSVVPNLKGNCFEAVNSARARSTDPALPVDGEILDELLPEQWGLAAIEAPQAWAMGALGQGVRIANLNTGVNPYHPDLAQNLDTELAISLVEGEDWRELPDSNPLGAGTWMAGAMVAGLNGFGIVGVAPEAKLVPVKVANNEGWFLFDAVIAGIVYAADIQADVINLSLGARLRKSGFYDGDVWVSAREVSELMVAWARAISHARQAGATVVAAAGDGRFAFDQDQDWVTFPAQLPGVIAVSATGPIGLYYDPNTNLDGLAPYSNTGQSGIHLAAPGGTGYLYYAEGDENGVYDMIRIVDVEGYGWSLSSGFSAAHVSGVAALIIGQNGGDMPPAQVEAILTQSADDLGKPGKDDYYGHGRVNAARAIRLISK